MDTRRVDLNLLLTLEALLAEHNVTRAAARLHLSQPAVSTQLSRLRQLFDDPLLIPARRGMTPTARAIELFGPLRESLDQVRAAVVTHRRFDPATTALTVSIACTDYLQAAIVAPLVVKLRKEASGVRIAIRQLDIPRLQQQMTHGEVDIAMMTPQSAPPDLRTRHLFDERYVLIGRKHHPKLRKNIGVADFAALEHVIVSPIGGGFTTPVDHALAALGQRRNVVLSAASFLFVPELVSRSNFVALVPQRLVQHRADILKIIECPFPVEGFAVSLLWHERSHNHSGHRWLREILVSLATAESTRSPRRRAHR